MTEIREALNSAIEQHTEGGAANDDREPAPVTAGSDVPSQPAKGESGSGDHGADSSVTAAAQATRARGPDGKFVAKPAANDNAEKAVPAAPQVTAGGNALSGGQSAAPSSPPVAQPEPLKAPQSWTALEREVWKGMTPEAQKAVLRRETEIARGLQESAEPRKQWQAWQQQAQPFEHSWRARGINPQQAWVSLAQTEAQLNTPQAPSVIANLIRQYRVDLDAINAQLGDTPAQAQPAAPYDPRFDQFLQQLQMAQMQRAQAEQQKREQELSDFAAKHEFFDDVREDIQDMMDVAQRRGRALTLEDAYNKAVRAHPEISEVLRQREAAKQANANSASTQRARAASSSVRSQPTAPVAQSEGDLDIRNLLRSQMNGSGQ